MSLVEMKGRQFNRLLVLDRAENDGRMAAWLCHCDCGNQSVVRGAHLRSGRVQSCGCHSKEATSLRRRTHDGTRSKAYRVWSGMRSRCENKNLPGYKNYGGRGISVCERWHSFENFLADMGHPPPSMTIERQDSDGNYEPGNCKWATWTEQQNNRRSNRRVTAIGETLTLAEWARNLGVKYYALYHQFHRKNRSIEQIANMDLEAASNALESEFT